MNKPKILITSAAGRTGTAAVLQLLQEGFPVRAFVRSRHARALALEKAGAELFVGDLYDFQDIRAAMIGVQRAYYCPPFAANLLQGAMLFALAAEEAKLEVVALMSQWQPHPGDPSIVSREHWIANQLYRWMPSVDVIHINPGLFAFIYMLGLPAIVHLGVLMGPFGDGRNAPPSNEDIARVVAGVLSNPAEHIGKSYRPTGPQLLSPQDVADRFGNVLGRQVRYQDSSINMFAKAATALGISNFEISQMRHYADALRHGAYAVGGPTDHVEAITGQKPEPFEDTARRYLADPSQIHPTLSVGSKMGAIMLMARIMLARVPDYDRWEIERGHPILLSSARATENREWMATATNQQLNLLSNPIGAAEFGSKLSNAL